ncbi:GNAT superfamily N-acetyltransferase [Conyzicola lurida]|uniref:GNAT superfamily N-acetyltransferase n=2 Tax=Conyzicola lurida TaxID=1172621 RepID=A0A841AI67_9MICO|nr:GNAT family N-acetyltransferase [Conyzicola lurida]MBB5842038.1 GNAT superfamily N-acetyltransferase [Conyzicola lurida]
MTDLHLPVDLETRSAPVTLRRATENDLAALMALLSDDPVSASRGDVASPDDERLYRDGLLAVLGEPGNELLVVTDAASSVIGTFQLTRIPGMARRGSTRLLVEAVRVRSDLRSAGIGAAMMRWVVDVAAPTLGVGLVQLTSDAARVDAHRFYERLGFERSHLGFKYYVAAGPGRLLLSPPAPPVLR